MNTYNRHRFPPEIISHPWPESAVILADLYSKSLQICQCRHSSLSLRPGGQGGQPIPSVLLSCKVLQSVAIWSSWDTCRDRVAEFGAGLYENFSKFAGGLFVGCGRQRGGRGYQKIQKGPDEPEVLDAGDVVG